MNHPESVRERSAQTLPIAEEMRRNCSFFRLENRERLRLVERGLLFSLGVPGPRPQRRSVLGAGFLFAMNESKSRSEAQRADREAQSARLAEAVPRKALGFISRARTARVGAGERAALRKPDLLAKAAEIDRLWNAERSHCLHCVDDMRVNRNGKLIRRMHFLRVRFGPRRYYLLMPRALSHICQVRDGKE